MIEIDIEALGMQELIDAVQKRKGRMTAAVRLAIGDMGALIRDEAVANAPRSPTNKQFSATLKRKRRTARKLFPGGLEKSIELEIGDGECSVFVSSNSLAGKYAKRIHDEKGRTWFRRGPGTIAKGPRADEKFIERAVNDNQEEMRRILEEHMEYNVIQGAMGR